MRILAHENRPVDWLSVILSFLFLLVIIYTLSKIVSFVNSRLEIFVCKNYMLVLKLSLKEERNMNAITSLTDIWLPLLVAALVQASLALGVSLLTLLSGQALASKSSKKAGLNRLSGFYVLGYFLVTVTAVINLSYVFLRFDWRFLDEIWAWLAIFTVLVGYIILLFYYRRVGKGTALWLPRSAAKYLFNQTRRVKNSFEAFLLGVASVLAELLFVVIPIIVAALTVSVMIDDMQFVGILVYSIVATMPLVILWWIQAAGGKLSVIQRWREKNKSFLQIISGLLMIILGLYLLILKSLGGGIW